MSSVIAAVANSLLFVVAAGAGLVWLRTRRSDKLAFALTGVLALGLVGLLVKVLGALWNDPRPFVVDHSRPLIAHAADNGFPSDHTALGIVIAVVVLLWSRRAGAALMVLAVVLGASRVLAHVHHVPDIVGGIATGIAAAVIAHLVVTWAIPRLREASARRRPAASLG